MLNSDAIVAGRCNCSGQRNGTGAGRQGAVFIYFIFIFFEEHCITVTIILTKLGAQTTGPRRS